MPDSWIEAYTNTDDPYDKAGAYGIQDEPFSPVESVTGSYLNVVGLSPALLSRLLLEAGVSLLNQKWGITGGAGGNNVYPNIPRIAETGQFAYNNGITSGAATNWDADAGNQNTWVGHAPALH